MTAMGLYALSLDCSISATPLSTAIRRTVINSIFDADLTEQAYQAKADRFDPYFVHWYEDHCDSGAGHVSIKAQREVLNIVAYLKVEGETRASIREKIRQSSAPAKPPPDSLIDESITLVARLWLMLSIGDLRYCLSPSQGISWGDGKLQDVVNAQFSPAWSLNDEVKLPKSFTALNLERMAGIRIGWTSSFEDHLMMQDDDTKVLLFHHVSFLELHKSSKSEIFNDDLIEETIKTLALLLPSSDARSNEWFEHKRRRLQLDPRAASCGHLNAAKRQISNFRYWRDRLIVLKQAFDDSEPHTVSQWWQDDRKKVQWYTFWIAALVLILTVVFGLVASVAGIIQAWAAVRSIPQKA